MTKRLLFVSLAVGSLLLPTLAGEKGYPKPELLVEPADLAKPEIASQFIVLDARDEAKYAEGRVPNARRVDPEVWAKAFQDGKDIAGWSPRIGQLGISPLMRIVIYDDTQGRHAARIWWILRYWGFDDVRLLNGGWAGWKAATLPTEKGEPKPAERVTLNLQPRAERHATKAHVLELLTKETPQIVDARSEGEFCGRQGFSKRGGSIPGAKHLEWSDLIDEQTERFKPAAELQRLFREAGIHLDQPTVTYCQSGGRSAVMAFGLELMGAKGVRNYYASWAEWGNAADTPVVTNEPKKQPGKE